MPLYTVKAKTNSWMHEGDVMHMTSFGNIMNMCRKINAEHIIINPSEDAIMINFDEIDDYVRDLDTAKNEILKLRVSGLGGDELFEPLLMSFDDCPVRCDVEGAVLTGTAYVDTDSEPMTVSLADFKTDRMTTVSVDKIKRIRVIHSMQVQSCIGGHRLFG
ncbi:MAG: hypothetical protein LUD51_05735 [Clostridia bacterium]|nr:hypothetical protein [Clostridia bacterium]